MCVGYIGFLAARHSAAAEFPVRSFFKISWRRSFHSMKRERARRQKCGDIGRGFLAQRSAVQEQRRRWNFYPPPSFSPPHFGAWEQLSPTPALRQRTPRANWPLDFPRLSQHYIPPSDIWLSTIDAENWGLCQQMFGIASLCHMANEGTSGNYLEESMGRRCHNCPIWTHQWECDDPYGIIITP